MSGDEKIGPKNALDEQSNLRALRSRKCAVYLSSAILKSELRSPIPEGLLFLDTGSYESNR